MRARNEEKAQAVLAALRRRATVVSGRVPTVRDILALGFNTLALSIAVVVVLPPAAWLLAALVPATVARWVLGLEQVIAGQDGFVVRSWRRSQFIA